MADAPPAKAGTPNQLQPLKYGVPPSGGVIRANTITVKTLNTLDIANGSPAKAGTPNPLQRGKDV